MRAVLVYTAVSAVLGAAALPKGGASWSTSGGSKTGRRNAPVHSHGPMPGGERRQIAARGVGEDIGDGCEGADVGMGGGSPQWVPAGVTAALVLVAALRPSCKSGRWPRREYVWQRTVRSRGRTCYNQGPDLPRRLSKGSCSLGHSIWMEKNGLCAMQRTRGGGGAGVITRDYTWVVGHLPVYTPGSIQSQPVSSNPYT